MTNCCSPWAALAGRIFLSAIFLMSGFAKITDWSGTAAHMEKQGMVAVPFFLAGAIALEIGGGLSVLLGCWARLGALALIVFLVPTTVIFHDFWVEEGARRTEQMIQFMKNLALLGGLFMVIAHGAGRLSLDHCLGRARDARTTAPLRDEAALIG
jgi:putative oxidoreductase